MAILTRRQLRPAMALVFIALVLATGWNAAVWLQARRINSAIDAVLAGNEVAVEKPAAEILFTQAWQHHSRNRNEEAIALYNLIGAGADVDRDLRVSSLYNLGNIYLRQGMARAEELSVDRARTGISLAKELYREALRLDPAHWDARYNLETAGYLVPDLPTVTGDEDASVPPPDGAWAEIQGFPPGLP